MECSNACPRSSSRQRVAPVWAARLPWRALTTDAPFRETAVAIARFRAKGILAVKMEPAALYAFAQARRKPLLCLTRVTNQMAVSVGDFAKGEADGAYASLSVIGPVGDAWRSLQGGPA